MSLVRVHNFAVSLDGFGTGEDQTLESPFGHAGERLMQWFLGTRSWSRRSIPRVNARVPLQLLRAGVQLAALIPPQALTRANAELSRSGVPFDLTQLKPEQLEALVEQLDEVTFELDQPDAKIRVFCE